MVGVELVLISAMPMIDKPQLEPRDLTNYVPTESHLRYEQRQADESFWIDVAMVAVVTAAIFAALFCFALWRRRRATGKPSGSSGRPIP